MTEVTVGAARPVPDELELVAIVAAAQALWPRPLAASSTPAGPGAWRFSGRWWAMAPHNGGWGDHRR